MTFYLTIFCWTLLDTCKWPSVKQKAPLADLEPVIKLPLHSDPANDLITGADIERDEQNLRVQDELTVEEGVGAGVQGNVTCGAHLSTH